MNKSTLRSYKNWVKALVIALFAALAPLSAFASTPDAQPVQCAQGQIDLQIQWDRKINGQWTWIRDWRYCVFDGARAYPRYVFPGTNRAANIAIICSALADGAWSIQLYRQESADNAPYGGVAEQEVTVRADVTGEAVLEAAVSDIDPEPIRFRIHFPH